MTTPTSALSRRIALSGCLGAGMVLLAPSTRGGAASPPANPDAVLLEQCRSYLDGYAALSRFTLEQERQHGWCLPEIVEAAQAAAVDDLEEILIEIGKEVAVTSAGHAARARVLWVSLGSLSAPNPGDEDWLVWSLVRDLALLDDRAA